MTKDECLRKIEVRTRAGWVNPVACVYDPAVVRRNTDALVAEIKRKKGKEPTIVEDAASFAQLCDAYLKQCEADRAEAKVSAARMDDWWEEKRQRAKEQSA